MKISRNKRKRQPIGMLGRTSGNHDWLLANASACASCGFRLRPQAIAFEWKPGSTARIADCASDATVQWLQRLHAVLMRAHLSSHHHTHRALAALKTTTKLAAGHGDM